MVKTGIFLSGVVCGVAVTAVAQSSTVASELKQIQDTSLRAVETQDAKLWGQGVSDDILIIPPDGRAITKQQRSDEIAHAVSAGPAAQGQKPVYDRAEYKLRIYGDDVAFTSWLNPRPMAIRMVIALHACS